jgi:hypothetical protein
MTSNPWLVNSLISLFSTPADPGESLQISQTGITDSLPKTNLDHSFAGPVETLAIMVAVLAAGHMPLDLLTYRT